MQHQAQTAVAVTENVVKMSYHTTNITTKSALTLFAITNLCGFIDEDVTETSFNV